MQIVLDIGKRELIYLILIISLLVSLGFVFGQASFNTSKPWHPLQRVATNESALISVDDNSNNIIDVAETVFQGCRLCEWDGGASGAVSACGNGYSVVQRGIINQTYNGRFNDLGIGGYPLGCGGDTLIFPEPASEFWLCCRG